MQKQRVYDLTREIARVAGTKGRAFDKVVSVWVSLLTGRISVREAEERLKRVRDKLIKRKR